MKCPFCQSNTTSVVDSRESREGQEIRRRRQCGECEQRFTTYERSISIYPWVIKRDDRREEFDPDKIMSGILRAIEKRPVSIHDAEELMQTVVQDLVANGEKEVTSERIGNLVMDHLKSLDQVAYVRFASVYRQFKDINDFMSELEGLLTKSKKKKVETHGQSATS